MTSDKSKKLADAMLKKITTYAKINGWCVETHNDIELAMKRVINGYADFIRANAVIKKKDH